VPSRFLRKKGKEIPISRRNPFPLFRFKSLAVASLATNRPTSRPGTSNRFPYSDPSWRDPGRICLRPRPVKTQNTRYCDRGPADRYMWMFCVVNGMQRQVGGRAEPLRASAESPSAGPGFDRPALGSSMISVSSVSPSDRRLIGSSPQTSPVRPNNSPVISPMDGLNSFTPLHKCLCSSCRQPGRTRPRQSAGRWNPNAVS